MMLNSKFRDVIKKLNYYLVRLHEGNGGLDWGGHSVPEGAYFCNFQTLWPQPEKVG